VGSTPGAADEEGATDLVDPVRAQHLEAVTGELEVLALGVGPRGAVEQARLRQVREAAVLGGAVPIGIEALRVEEPALGVPDRPDPCMRGLLDVPGDDAFVVRAGHDAPRDPDDQDQRD
jgi:hypothetical protein